MKKITSFAKRSLWILLAILPISNLCGQSTSDTADSSAITSEYIRNVKRIHQDLVKGDLARREVVDLRGRLQSCEIENNNLENSLRTSQGKELALTNSLMESHQETEKERKEKRAARWEVWLWRLGTAGIVVWKISTAFR